MLHTIRNNRPLFLLPILLLGTSIPLESAYSQEEEQEEIEEVTVYSTKKSRGSELQSVAAMIDVFNEAAIAQQNIRDIEDIGRLPNVQLDAASAVSGQTNFTIRGLAVNTSTPSIDPTVGTFVDGIYLGSTYGAIVDFFDLESIEVLKGPQGVLFGRNVTGGAVMVRTKRPDGERRVTVNTGIETGLKYIVSATMEDSLTDSLAGKLALYYSDDQGQFDNITINRDTGQLEQFIVRPSFVYSPNESFSSTLIVETGSQEGDGGQNSDARGATRLNPPNTLITKSNRPGFADIEWLQVTSETDIAFAGGTLTNLFGYREVDSATSIDLDGTETDEFALQTLLDQNQISNELRWNADIRDNWNLMVGAYIYESEFDYVEARELSVVPRDPASGFRYQIGGGSQEHSVLGLFLNNDIALSDRLTLNLGVRWTDESKDAIVYALGQCDSTSFEGSIYDSPGSRDACVGVPPHNDIRSTSVTNVIPKIGLQYSVSDDVMFYSHYTQGNRSPGFNLRTPPSRPGIPFEEEEASAIELGIKSTLFDGRVRFNAAVFQTDYDSMQLTASFDDPVDGIVQAIINPADARIRGLEIDSILNMGGGLQFTFGLGLLDAEYTTIREDINGGGITAEDFDLRLLRVPDVTANAALIKDFTFWEQGDTTLRIEYNHRSDNTQNVSNNARNPESDKVNANLTFSPFDSNFSVAIYGRNLTDENFPGSIGTVGGGRTDGEDGGQTGGMNKGRTLGLEVRMEF